MFSILGAVLQRREREEAARQRQRRQQAGSFGEATVTLQQSGGQGPHRTIRPWVGAWAVASEEATAAASAGPGY